MKIIYESCGVKNYIKEDHPSYRHNIYSCEKKSLKKFRLFQAFLFTTAKTNFCD